MYQKKTRILRDSFIKLFFWPPFGFLNKFKNPKDRNIMHDMQYMPLVYLMYNVP